MFIATQGPIRCNQSFHVSGAYVADGFNEREWDFRISRWTIMSVRDMEYTRRTGSLTPRIQTPYSYKVVFASKRQKP